MTQAALQRGERVEFISDSEGKLAGHVLDIQRSVENAQAFVIVEIEHELPGILHHVPIERVARKAA